MATIRTRQTKKGTVYDIQAKITNKGTGEVITRTTTWTPDCKMTARKEEQAVNDFAQEFENQINKLVNNCTGEIDNPNTTFREYGALWCEKKQNPEAPLYGMKCKDVIEFSCEYIGGIKMKDFTPAIIQGFFDKLDKLEKTTIQVTPKSDFREVLASYGFKYVNLRYEYNINSTALAAALKGKSVSKTWASGLCGKTKIPFDLLFDETIVKEPYAFETTHQRKRVIRTFFAYAKKKGVIKENYATADYIDFPKQKKTKIKCMDDEQAQKFFETSINHKDIRVKTAMLLFLFTGFRRGEITGLQWKNINFSRRIISVGFNVISCKKYGKVIKTPKTEDSDRSITINQLLIDTLKEYRVYWEKQVEMMGDILPIDIDWLFFSNNGEVIYPGIFNKWLDDILDRADLPHYTPHTLRHTNVTLQIISGVDVTTVSGRAGHAKTSTTQDMYSHFIRSSDAIAADKLEQMFIKNKGGPLSKADRILATAYTGKSFLCGTERFDEVIAFLADYGIKVSSPVNLQTDEIKRKVKNALYGDFCLMCSKMRQEDCWVATAYTGVLFAESLGSFYKYIDSVLGTSVQAAYLQDEAFWSKIKETAKAPFQEMIKRAAN